VESGSKRGLDAGVGVLFSWAARMSVPPSSSRRLWAILPYLWVIARSQGWTPAIGVIFVVINRLASLVPPVVTRIMVDDVVGAHRVDLLGGLTLVLVAAALVQAVAGQVRDHLFPMWAARTLADVRGRVHAHVIRLPLAYHDAQRTGAIGSQVMNDAAGLYQLFANGVPSFVSSLVTGGVGFALMCWQSPKLAASAGVGVVFFGGLAAIVTHRTRAILRRRNRILADVNGRLAEALGGIRVLKAYRAEPREDEIFEEGMARMVTNYAEQARLSSRTNLFTIATWSLAGALVAFAGVRLILARELSLGGFFAFTMLLGYMITPALLVSTFGELLMDAVAGFDHIRAVLAERPEADDPRRRVVIGPLRGEVSFEHVDFAYEPGRPVLHDVSFHAAPGTVTALCGPSGGGKSTILGLVAAFHVPSQGTIRIDGTDLATVRLDAYRAGIGVVLQETFLFAGTILENIAFARPGATREEVVRAARMAHVDEFADRAPQGYDTLIGERGVRLSGGERQRIAMARAFLADPQILILDEATSNLDANSEALIQEALAEIVAGRTTFVIAHRLTTIQRADQILLIDGGRVVERGTHAELVTKGGLYSEMHARQQLMGDAPFGAARHFRA
jgi:ABC-type multidrug transport system fused ATPase/permease subunit